MKSKKQTSRRTLFNNTTAPKTEAVEVSRSAIKRRLSLPLLDNDSKLGQLKEDAVVESPKKRTKNATAVSIVTPNTKFRRLRIKLGQAKSESKSRKFAHEPVIPRKRVLFSINPDYEGLATELAEPLVPDVVVKAAKSPRKEKRQPVVESPEAVEKSIERAALKLLRAEMRLKKRAFNINKMKKRRKEELRIKRKRVEIRPRKTRTPKSKGEQNIEPRIPQAKLPDQSEIDFFNKGNILK
jgi:hypothetical protein